MRLANIEELDWWNDLYMKGVNHSGVWVRYKDAEEFIKKVPTVDAIPVEQAARMFAKVIGMPPCALDTVPETDKRHEHCEKHCGVDDSDVLCWLHAIKEGWLDDED